MPGQSENLVTSCPQCNSLVGLPSIMSLDAVVRCPVCGHKYTLRSRLPQSIPQLELVSQSEIGDEEEADSAPEIDPNAKLQVSEILRKNAKLNRRRRRGRSGSEGGRRQTVDAPPAAGVSSGGKETTNFRDFQELSMGTIVDEEPPATEAAEWSAGEGTGLQTAGDLAAFERKVASRSKHKRRPSRKVQQWVEIVKIAMGALLALPVAQLIIWWGLSVDPLKLAPTVAKAIPYVVPAKVLETTEEE